MFIWSFYFFYFILIAWETASLQQLDFNGNQSDESSETMQAEINEIKEMVIHEGLGNIYWLLLLLFLFSYNLCTLFIYLF